MGATEAAETGLNEIAPGIHEVRLPIPWEEEIVNCFLFSDGSQVDLLDCGVQSDESVATVLALSPSRPCSGCAVRRC